VRVLIAGVIIAAGVLVLLANVGRAASSEVSSSAVLQPTPAVGGLTAIVRVHFIADGVDGDYGPDFLEVMGPAGTPCASDVVYGDVNGPHQDSSGPVTLYIGPSARRQYVWGANTFDLMSAVSERALTRWCAGSYSAHIGFLGAPGTDGVDDTFQFRIAGNGATKLRITVARGPRSVAVTPDRGGPDAAFSVRYRADAAAYDSGDVVEVDGPNRSVCRGSVVRVAAGRRDKRKGPLTLRIGPGTARPPYRESGNGKALRRWCPGAYKGTIFYEHGPKFTIVAGFKLRVQR
jgi:hypothetical protein